ncbi:hypothetical protein ACFOY8_14555 [Thalassospira xianhensis]|uniref:Uncharacterized protein n=1 Tax=Thalassospira xianhensis MCCC 1A02616 TaxID=1177929 RepID=A0A367UH46_9PROT|nr:hypothetical protein [Thalassospira xianhensis]RCK07626.1 hypothetical protein TH5_00690 [Thalassospira xianhensis MCCC 1A02616]
MPSPYHPFQKNGGRTSKTSGRIGIEHLLVDLDNIPNLIVAAAINHVNLKKPGANFDAIAISGNSGYLNPASHYLLLRKLAKSFLGTMGDRMDEITGRSGYRDKFFQEMGGKESVTTGNASFPRLIDLSVTDTFIQQALQDTHYVLCVSKAHSNDETRRKLETAKSKKLGDRPVLLGPIAYIDGRLCATLLKCNLTNTLLMELQQDIQNRFGISVPPIKLTENVAVAKLSSWETLRGLHHSFYAIEKDGLVLVDLGAHTDKDLEARLRDLGFTKVPLQRKMRAPLLKDNARAILLTLRKKGVSLCPNLVGRLEEALDLLFYPDNSYRGLVTMKDGGIGVDDKRIAAVRIQTNENLNLENTFKYKEEFLVTQPHEAIIKLTDSTVDRLEAVIRESQLNVSPDVEYHIHTVKQRRSLEASSVTPQAIRR